MEDVDMLSVTMVRSTMKVRKIVKEKPIFSPADAGSRNTRGQMTG